ncbi:HEPN domain-containing protein [Spirosoma endbachense]|uniref:Uncharacterized protein n=1 Tax=Spirosoma endbachense TaxID=2666025 RepID=A0A6P1W0P0_9BACT|nr:HEPN domain-containing protein [Spirosoma endbachense]QHV97862.1 hypothetical protein GJR95_23910 [Spirosoma endbachense]
MYGGIYSFSLRRATIQNFFHSYSNALGRFEDTSYTLNDINYAMQLGQKIKALSPEPVTENYKLELDLNEISFSKAHYINYNQLSRIRRALQFLNQARSSPQLLVKISFYVLVLECLFSANDATEINHKISERVAIYVGVNGEEKYKLFKFVKKVYGIRSKYVHGQMMDKKLSENAILSEISKELDELVRIVLLKVILVDSANFLLKDEALTEWFNSSLFK